MSSSVGVDTHSPTQQRARAVSVRVDAERVWVETVDGRVLGVPIAHFPWLQDAPPAARARVELTGAGYMLLWDELDEVIPVPALFGLPF